MKKDGREEEGAERKEETKEINATRKQKILRVLPFVRREQRGRRRADVYCVRIVSTSGTSRPVRCLMVQSYFFFHKLTEKKGGMSSCPKQRRVRESGESRGLIVTRQQVRIREENAHKSEEKTCTISVTVTYPRS